MSCIVHIASVFSIYSILPYIYSYKCAATTKILVRVFSIFANVFFFNSATTYTFIFLLTNLNAPILSLLERWLTEQRRQHPSIFSAAGPPTTRQKTNWPALEKAQLLLLTAPGLAAAGPVCAAAVNIEPAQHAPRRSVSITHEQLPGRQSVGLPRRPVRAVRSQSAVCLS